MTPPRIADVKELAHRYESRGVLVLCISAGRFSITSYGMTRKDCDAMKSVNDQLANLILSGDLTLPSGLGYSVELCGGEPEST